MKNTNAPTKFQAWNLPIMPKYCTGWTPIEPPPDVVVAQAKLIDA